MQAIRALQEEGIHVVGLISIFSYGLPAAEKIFSESGIPFISLSNLSTLLGVAREDSALTAEQLETVRDWQRDPLAWHNART